MIYIFSLHLCYFVNVIVESISPFQLCSIILLHSLYILWSNTPELNDIFLKLMDRCWDSIERRWTTCQSFTRKFKRWISSSTWNSISRKCISALSYPLSNGIQVSYFYSWLILILDSLTPPFNFFFCNNVLLWALEYVKNFLILG